MLKQLDEYKARLDAFRPLGPELLPEIKAYYRVGLTYTSTALEGFTYTESETKVLLEEGLTVGGKPLRDALAVTGHAKAYDYMFSLLGAEGLTCADILAMHRLLAGALESGQAGAYRQRQVFVTGTSHAFPAPSAVPRRMDELGAWLVEARDALHPVEYAARLHLRLVSIHPFEDGNGRTARLAMNAALLQRGYLPAVIPPVLRAEYIASIKDAQEHGAESQYLTFMYRREIETMKEMLRLLQGTA